MSLDDRRKQLQTLIGEYVDLLGADSAWDASVKAMEIRTVAIALDEETYRAYKETISGR